MWQTAAPAFAASMHAIAISAGVMGRPGCCFGEVILPVTAHVTMTFLAILGSARAEPMLAHSSAAAKARRCPLWISLPLRRAGTRIGGAREVGHDPAKLSFGCGTCG